MLAFYGLSVIILANITSSSEDAKNDSQHGTFHFDFQHKLQASIVRTIVTIHNCADKTTSVFIKGSRILPRERFTASHQRSLTYCDNSSLGYFWSSVSLALASKGVHSELTTRNLTKQYILSSQIAEYKLDIYIGTSKSHQNCLNFDLKVL